MSLRFCLLLFVILTLNLTTNHISAEEISQISSKQTLIDETDPSSLNNTMLKGLEFLFTEKYEDALTSFNHVLNTLHFEDKLYDPLFGSALWGRLLCCAYNNQDQEAFLTLSLIRSHFIDSHCHYCGEFAYISERNYRILKVADFANPNERISSAECKERVRGTASVMRLLAMKIPNRMLADAINFTISELEYAALQCCDRSHWTDCLSPIVDSWNYLKKCMDKGIAIAPNLATPGR